MTAKPRLRLAELLLEISLTKRRHLVVEGAEDNRFFRAWALDIEFGTRIVITSVDDIEISDTGLETLGLNDGQRSRVIYVAHEADAAGIDMRCVADRDCGHGVESHEYETLLWTDFPALESYALDEATLDRANLLSFQERLPPASELLPALSHALRELFAVRLQHEHLPAPRYEHGFRGTPRDLAHFDVGPTVDARIRAMVAEYPRPESDDPRSYAYGHDIAELLLCAFGNAIKNQAGFRTRTAVESVLRSAMQVVGTYRSERLFQDLERWAAA